MSFKTQLVEIDSIHIYVGYVVSIPCMVSDLKLQYLAKSKVLFG